MTVLNLTLRLHNWQVARRALEALAGRTNVTHEMYERTAMQETIAFYAYQDALFEYFGKETPNETPQSNS